MQFDRLTVVLLVLRDDAPILNEAESAALQDAHMAHIADLHDAGVLLAAGPLLDHTYRGLTIFSVGPDEARELAEQNPGVQAGRFSIQVLPWMVPGGAIEFNKEARFPRSMSEASA